MIWEGIKREDEEAEVIGDTATPATDGAEDVVEEEDAVTVVEPLAVVAPFVRNIAFRFMMLLVPLLP